MVHSGIVIMTVSIYRNTVFQHCIALKLSRSQAHSHSYLTWNPPYGRGAWEQNPQKLRACMATGLFVDTCACSQFLPEFKMDCSSHSKCQTITRDGTAYLLCALLFGTELYNYSNWPVWCPPCLNYKHNVSAFQGKAIDLLTHRFIVRRYVWKNIIFTYTPVCIRNVCITF